VQEEASVLLDGFKRLGAARRLRIRSSNPPSNPGLIT
jgi:hypothetical protein